MRFQDVLTWLVNDASIEERVLLEKLLSRLIDAPSELEKLAANAAPINKGDRGASFDDVKPAEYEPKTREGKLWWKEITKHPDLWYSSTELARISGIERKILSMTLKALVDRNVLARKKNPEGLGYVYKARD